MIGYLPEKKEYGIFPKKYLMNGELAKQGNKSRQCANGVIKRNCFYATLFVNGYQLPDAYSMEDINYFLL
jgi:hypothetical protein